MVISEGWRGGDLSLRAAGEAIQKIDTKCHPRENGDPGINIMIIIFLDFRFHGNDRMLIPGLLRRIRMLLAMTECRSNGTPRLLALKLAKHIFATLGDI
jgi:hypothetical protein